MLKRCVISVHSNVTKTKKCDLRTMATESRGTENDDAKLIKDNDDTGQGVVLLIAHQ